MAKAAKNLYACGEGGATGDDLHRRRGHDDERVVAGGFDQHRLEAQRGALRHCLTGRYAAGEGHGMGVWVRHQMAADVGAAGQALHQSGRQMVEGLHDQQQGQRGQLRRLDDDGVAGG